MLEAGGQAGRVHGHAEVALEAAQTPQQRLALIGGSQQQQRHVRQSEAHEQVMTAAKGTRKQRRSQSNVSRKQAADIGATSYRPRAWSLVVVFLTAFDFVSR